MAKSYFFHYDQTKIETDDPTLSAAELKQLIKQQVPAFDPTHDLVIEGKGNDPDVAVADGQVIDLSPQKGGPKKFFSRPPTNFGGQG